MRVKSARFAIAMLSMALLVPWEARAEAGLPGGEAIGEPITSTLGQLATAQVSSWRSPRFEVFRWDLFPDILVIDTADFRIQDLMFTRIAFFIEKKGFRGTLMTDAQLSGRHGWNAHDYNSAGLAAFFNAAADREFPLDAEEKALEGLALREGIIVPFRDIVAPGRGGVLSISRSSSVIDRAYLLIHESFHGIFFSSSEYREFSFRLWDSLTSDERRFYETFLDSLGYASEDRYLAVNEFQAYLMQQPLDYALSYFERFQGRFGGRLAASRLLATAKELDGFLRSHFGLSAGETVGLALKGSPGR